MPEKLEFEEWMILVMAFNLLNTNKQKAAQSRACNQFAIRPGLWAARHQGRSAWHNSVQVGVCLCVTHLIYQVRSQMSSKKLFLWRQWLQFHGMSCRFFGCFFFWLTNNEKWAVLHATSNGQQCQNHNERSSCDVTFGVTLPQNTHCQAEVGNNFDFALK